jgi:hypothetical protein
MQFTLAVMAKKVKNSYIEVASDHREMFYLIMSLFNDVLSSSDYTAYNDRMITIMRATGIVLLREAKICLQTYVYAVYDYF